MTPRWLSREVRHSASMRWTGSRRPSASTSAAVPFACTRPAAIRTSRSANRFARRGSYRAASTGMAVAQALGVGPGHAPIENNPGRDRREESRAGRAAAASSRAKGRAGCLRVLTLSAGAFGLRLPHSAGRASKNWLFSRASRGMRPVLPAKKGGPAREGRRGRFHRGQSSLSSVSSQLRRIWSRRRRKMPSSLLCSPVRSSQASRRSSP